VIPKLAYFGKFETSNSNHAQAKNLP